jgi:hypothetical protein
MFSCSSLLQEKPCDCSSAHFEIVCGMQSFIIVITKANPLDPVQNWFSLVHIIIIKVQFNIISSSLQRFPSSLHVIFQQHFMCTCFLHAYFWSCLSIHLWLYRPLLDLGCFFSFLILYTVGRTPWWGISSSQGCYLHMGQHKHRINAHRHPCLEWDSNQLSQHSSGRRQFML